MKAPYVDGSHRTVPVAKQQLVDYCGSVEDAEAVWREAQPAHDPATDREWIALMDRAARRRMGVR